jgi:pimeloyl-ACP methyl ester carboxylesterase
VNRQLAKRAERRNPPVGRFIEVDGVRLHYVEHGTGEPLVMLHGNGSMIQDFATSGLVKKAAETYRVIVFDRPGFGYSNRPRGKVWTPDAQAALLRHALARLGFRRGIFLGHSWGASVAVAFALRYPQAVSALVLASGYYYPSARADAFIQSGPAIPVVGDILNHTVAPFLVRLIWPLLMLKLFGPAPVSIKFDRFTRELAVRPSQLRSGAAEAALMIPDAFAAHHEYAKLRMPVVIIAGERDRFNDTERQSARLHRDVRQSTFHCVRNVGHMVHHTSAGDVMSAINEAAAAALDRESGALRGTS